MIELLSISAEQIDSSHIESFVDSRVPEGEQIEFKESLSAKGDGTPDSWMSGGDRIGDRAKNEILEEVVAFANAHGGALFLGIRESAAKPAVANQISPVPRCEELAERLKLVFRDCVEPQLPVLEIFAVSVEGADDGGVVVIRVGRSQLAPHRVTKTLVCPVRRADRCEKMTMREIKDMTLNVARGFERLDKRFSERSKRFCEEFGYLETPDKAFGIRITAMPVVDEIHIDRVFRRCATAEEFREPLRTVSLHEGGENPSTLNGEGIIRSYPFSRPLLRAVREELDSSSLEMKHSYSSYRELHCDGLIETGFVSCGRNSKPLTVSEQEGDLYLSPNLYIFMFANMLIWANRIRMQAQAPAAEYAFEVEIHAIGISASPGTSSFRRGLPGAVLQPGSVKFPRYPLGTGDPDEISGLLTLFRRDFWNSLGKDVDSERLVFTIED